MPGASFQQIPQLTLSTAAQLRFAGGVFDVFNTPSNAIAALGSDPLPGAMGLLPGALGEKRPWIRMEGISIDVDEALLVDAPGGRIDVDNSRLSVSNPSGDAGSLTLTADLIKVGDGTELLATGSGNGGLVQVGGSWQNTDPRVRQATQTWMQQGSTVDASSLGFGDGGTIAIWSDPNNPSGGTIAEGVILARAGAVAGDGGRIETSGAYLLAQPQAVDVSAIKGSAGEWLLDPYNITIGYETGTIFPAPSKESNSSVLFGTVARTGAEKPRRHESTGFEGTSAKVNVCSRSVSSSTRVVPSSRGRGWPSTNRPVAMGMTSGSLSCSAEAVGLCCCRVN